MAQSLMCYLFQDLAELCTLLYGQIRGIDRDKCDISSSKGDSPWITERLSTTHKKMILRENKLYDLRYDACPKYVCHT